MGFLKLARLGCQVALLTSLLLAPCRLPAQSRSYDGVWWQLRTSAEQEGFIFGYGDCYADPAGQKIRMSLDDANMRIAVGIFYQSHEKLRTRPVAEVLKDIWAGHVPVHESKHASPGEGWRERHGYFDGTWWKGSNNTEQLGFVEGYIACHGEQRKAKPLQLEPEKYAERLSAWYTPGGDESVAAQHQAEKIADVLSRFSGPPGSARR
jgi:hypothetical protein